VAIEKVQKVPSKVSEESGVEDEKSKNTSEGCPETLLFLTPYFLLVGRTPLTDPSI
jgi:hypothetical protein